VLGCACLEGISLLQYSTVRCGALRSERVCVSRIVRELEVEYRIEYEYADVCGGRWQFVRSFVRSLALLLERGDSQCRSRTEAVKL